MTRRTRRRTDPPLLLATLLVLATAVACGGSSTSTAPGGPGHRAFLASVDKVCAAAVTAHDGHTLPVTGFDPEHPDPGQLPAVADYFSRYGGLPATTAALHRLSPPRRDAAAWRDLLAVADRMTANARRQIDVARRRDAADFVTTVHRANRLMDQVNAAGERLGLSGASPCRQVFG